MEKGYTLGHYKIISAIGKGGMGEVFLAQDTKLDRKVAIKFLNEEFAQDADKLNRFIQEAKAASALNHPNILTVHEIGEADGKNYIATEFIKGKTLREQLSGKGAFQLNSILKVGVQVSEALAAAHEEGIVHRDIKPENIMIRQDGYAKVLDFGLAKLTEKKQSESISLEGDTKALVNTTPGMVMGTVSYMSPEQARGKETDARTDIWSLGVVLYEMLAGKVPFTGETINHTIVAILEKEPLLLENVPDELQRIVRKAVTKDKDMRYQSAKDLLIDLKNLRRTLDIQGELERSMVPNREVTTNTVPENATQIYTEKSIEETKGEDAKQTQNLTTSSSLEYAVTQAKSNKFATAMVGIILVSIISAIAYFGFFTKSNAKQIESIAVMPFVNESGNADVEYLSDGMTETLISSLSNLPNLNVKPRSSVFRYKGKDTNLQTIAKELNVQAILNGRVVQRGEDISLFVELTDISLDKVIWSETYKRKQSDLVNLQTDIARDVSSKLKSKLSGADEAKVTKTYTTNPEAYQLYLKGRYHATRFTQEGFSKAIEEFNQAIAIDPTYALAYDGLAYCYYSSWYIPAKEASPKAKAAAMKALEIDPNLAEAHASLANVYLWFEYDWVASEREYKRAIELNPNYGYAHGSYGVLLATSGRFDEAIAEAKRGVEIEPLSAELNTFLGLVYYYAKQYDAAAKQLNNTIEFEPDFWWANTFLARTYERKGGISSAIPLLEKTRKMEGATTEVLGALGNAYALAGKREDAEKIIEELKQPSNQIQMDGYEVAIIYAALGNKDQAFAYLDKEYSKGAWFPIFIKVDPDLDSLRDDPRFKELLKRMGLPE